MPWLASLALDYALRPGPDGAPRTVAHARHQGPLRVMRSLYPEPGGVCHQVLVHPPSGLVGGDTLDIQLHMQAGTHSVITTPGATRFYRSLGAPAVQSIDATLEAGSRLEWLPLENIAYSGCIAQNRVRFTLHGDAQVLAWDIAALGLPASTQAFERGSLQQHLEVTGAWTERGLIAAADLRLLNSPLGLHGHRCMATLVLASGQAIARPQRDDMLERARALITAHPLSATAGATAAHPQVIVLRVLSAMVEPAFDLLQQVRGAWRDCAWALPPVVPRVWLGERAGGVVVAGRSSSLAMAER